MPRVTLNLTEAKSFEPVEPGVYTMSVSQVEPAVTGKNAKQPGQAMLNVSFRFLDPAIDQRAGTVLRSFMLEGKGSGFTRELWKACTGTELPVGESFDVDTDEILGRTLHCDVVNEEYEGRLTNKINKFTAAN